MKNLAHKYAKLWNSKKKWRKNPEHNAVAYRKGVIIKWQNQEAVKEKCNPFITNAERKQIAFSRN